MIFDTQGRRKYLTPKERERFIRSCGKLATCEEAFCLMLAFSGCRISEALALTPDRIDLDMRAVIIQCLKKRREEPVYRAVPLPDWVLTKLKRHLETIGAGERLWPWSRGKGWLIIKRVMAGIRLTGAHACPKGLRHGFGVFAVQSGIPLNLLQRWLGHEKLETTAIYANAIGAEERRIAQRMWRGSEPREAA
ncbi:tyrosine-type recombinase/integrase [Maricaulis sp.]|uniref:tyrosine-type recombinase/integrase n=1 Tax=Maricaulis sp. TaxID=1486257 RepID=UPI0032986CF3